MSRRKIYTIYFFHCNINQFKYTINILWWFVLLVLFICCSRAYPFSSYAKSKAEAYPSNQLMLSNYEKGFETNQKCYVLLWFYHFYHLILVFFYDAARRLCSCPEVLTVEILATCWRFLGVKNASSLFTVIILFKFIKELFGCGTASDSEIRFIIFGYMRRFGSLTFAISIISWLKKE